MANRDVPELCFSCIMDEKWATQEFRKRQPPIFARDALTAKVIGGRSAYHALLEEAPWMGEYFPAFYSMRLARDRTRGGRASRLGARSGERQGSACPELLPLSTRSASFLRMKSWTLNRRLTKAA